MEEGIRTERLDSVRDAVKLRFVESGHGVCNAKTEISLQEK